jgi:glycosyltransferase involved in cell wall biosynthesis
MGGAERSLYDVLASLRKAQPQWKLTLIVPEEGPLETKVADLGVATRIVPFGKRLSHLGDAGARGLKGKRLERLRFLYGALAAILGIASYVRFLRRDLQHIAPDVIHANGLKMHILSIWAQPTKRIPVIWHIHDYVSKRPLMSRLLKMFSPRCAAAVVNSKSVGNDLRSICGEGLKTYTVYNGVDLETFTPEGKQLDLDALSGLLPAGPGIVRVGLLATMAHWKGHETFLKSLSLLAADTPVRGYIIGGPIYQTRGSQFSSEELRELATRLGVEHRVGFTGFIDDSAAAIRSLDVLVHASTEPEPFGLVIVEGMACGRSVIASGAGGASEILTLGDAALSHPPGDAETLSYCINQLACNAELRSRLSQAGRAIAERCFDRVRLARELIPVYQEVVRAVR